MHSHGWFLHAQSHMRSRYVLSVISLHNYSCYTVLYVTRSTKVNYVGTNYSIFLGSYIFKPGVCQPQAGTHLIASVCKRLHACVCVCVRVRVRAQACP